MEEGKGESMPTVIRLLLSVVGVGAMFALGRLVRAQIDSQGVGVKNAKGRPRLRALPSPAVPEEDKVEVRDEVNPNRILIHVSPVEAYDHARKLEYPEGILFGLGLQMSVIIDEPGEFFGLRVEHEGELYGTALVHFEEIPGKAGGTEVSVSVKYKHDFGVYSKKAIEEGVNAELALYLNHLKEACEKHSADKAAI